MTRAEREDMEQICRRIKAEFIAEVMRPSEPLIRFRPLLKKD